MHAERLLYSIRVPIVMSTAQAVFLLERGHTDRQTDRQTRLNALPTPGAMPAWVTKSSAIAHGPCDTLYLLKCCQLLHAVRKITLEKAFRS